MTGEVPKEPEEKSTSRIKGPGSQLDLNTSRGWVGELIPVPPVPLCRRYTATLKQLWDLKNEMATHKTLNEKSIILIPQERQADPTVSLQVQDQSSTVTS